jgi:sterol desaturase/sphingolipid hydroxylase (fatty acid hydroxylase superfamily)
LRLSRRLTQELKEREMAMLALHLACSLAFVYALFSLVENVTHRHLMHRMRWARRLGIKFLDALCFNHMAKHDKREYRHGSNEDDDHLSHILIAAACVGLPFVPIVWYIDPLTVFVGGVFTVLCSFGWWLVHHEMHRNKGRFFASTAIFRYLERRHQLHHLYPNSNYNVVLPLWDWIFGTYHAAESKPARRRRVAAH